MKYLLLTLVGGLLCSCYSVDELLDRGRADEAFYKALQQLENHHRPRQKHYDRLAYSFEIARLQDRNAIARLERELAPGRWPALHHHFKKLFRRRAGVVPHTPLDAAVTYWAGYSPQELAERLEVARLRSGGYYKGRGDDQRALALAGDKPAARRGHCDYRWAKAYLPERRDLDALRELMKDLGTVRAHLYPVGEREVLARAGVRNEDFSPHREFWIELYHGAPQSAIDLEVEYQLNDFRDHGPHESSSSHTYSKEVLDYVEKKKVRERRGDSTVTVIKLIEHYKTIYATETTVRQTYELEVTGRCDVYGPRDSTALYGLAKKGRAGWSNTYSVCSGAADALPAFACSGAYRPPPSRTKLLREASRNFVRSVRGEILKRHRPPELCPPELPLVLDEARNRN